MLRLALLFFSLIAWSESVPQWSLEKLDGRDSYHSGANCHNGVLAGLGYIDELVLVTDAELTFYLDHFCEKNESAPVAGDIVLKKFEKDPTIPHSGIYLGKSQLFEKGGTSGLYEKRSTDRVLAAQYRTKYFWQSPEFVRCDDGTCYKEFYTCKDASSVRATMMVCQQRLRRMGLSPLREELSFNTLNPDEVVKITTLLALEDFVTALDDVPNDFCTPYILGVAYSTYFHLFNIFSRINNSAEQYDVDIPKDKMAGWKIVIEELRRKLEATKKIESSDPTYRKVVALFKFKKQD